MHIALQKVSKRYGYQWIIRDLDLQVEDHMVLGIKGLNGSGKSTLVKILSGYLSPSLGSITFQLAGKPVSTSHIYQHISWVAPYLSLTDNYTIAEMYHLQSKFKPMKTKDFDTFLDLVQLSKHQNKYIKEFSSGMQQRLQLGLAILTDSPLLLLDEPTSYLDMEAIKWYHDLLSTYKSGRTVVIASNDESDLAYCDKFISMNDLKQK